VKKLVLGNQQVTKSSRN